METAAKFALPALAFVLTLASGFWLSQAGRPYSTLIFTVHKLVALGAVVFTAIQAVRTLQTGPAPAGAIVLWVAAGVCLLALFASGALLSLDHPARAAWLTLHRLAPLGALAAAAGAILIKF